MMSPAVFSVAVKFPVALVEMANLIYGQFKKKVFAVGIYNGPPDRQSVGHERRLHCMRGAVT